MTGHGLLDKSCFMQNFFKSPLNICIKHLYMKGIRITHLENRYIHPSIHIIALLVQVGLKPPLRDFDIAEF